MKYQQLLQKNYNPNLTNNSFNSLIQSRMNYLFITLFDLRKQKILLSIMKKNEIPSSYLNQFERRFYLSLKLAYLLYDYPSIKFEDQTNSLLDSFFQILPSDWLEKRIEKNLELSEMIDSYKIEFKNTNSDKNFDLIKVKFLEDVNSFLGLKNEIYGPYKKEEVAFVPFIFVDRILKPNKMVRINFRQITTNFFLNF